MVEAAAAARGVEAQIRLTEGPGHAQALARDSVESGCRSVIVWGGDGTVNEAGSALLGSPTALGLVPAGSGNGLAAALGVSRVAEAALADAFDAPVHPIDAGIMAGRPFFNVAGIGFDARVASLFSHRAAGSRGGWTYVTIGVREGCRYCSLDYALTLDESPMRLQALLIAFANGQEYGMGARIAPDARLDDGVLDAVIVQEPGSVLRRFWQARHLATGRPQRAPSVSLRRIRRAVIETGGNLEFHVDGEPGVAAGRIEVSVLPGALNVRTRALL